MIATRRAILGGLAAAPAAVALPALARRAGPDGTAALDAVFAATPPPALAGAIVTRDGLAWADVRGVRKAGGSDLATVEDRWHIGSNTKAMTAALFGRLVDSGRAAWDLTVRQAFPGVAADPAWRETRLVDLMHHRAGLLDAELIDRDWLAASRADSRSLPAQRQALAAAAFGKPPAGQPGAFAYGNANYILIGAAIESLAGRSWEEAMTAELFRPLEMERAGFGAPPDPNAWGHRPGPLPMDPAGPGADNPAALGPAGTVSLSIADYAKFLRVFLTEGGDWLSPATVARLTAPAEGPPPAYACGWGVLQRPWGGAGGQPVATLGHDGSNTMWHCSVMAAPARGVAVAAFANDTQTGRGAAQALVQQLIPVATA